MIELRILFPALLAATLLSSVAAQAQTCTGEPNGTPCTSDGVDCTDDVCIAGNCEHLPSPDSTPCTDDGLECTLDICVSSACTHEPRPAGAPCGDSSNTECTNPDLCDGSGTCLINHAPDGAPCEDGSFCTDLDACYDGGCVGGRPTCPPGEVCDEGAELCIECTTAAECNDHNPCTVDVCSSNQCVHDPNTGAPCGSGVDDDCTNPDACDLFGDCRSNDEIDGTPCAGGNGQCYSGICDAPDFSTSPLPEDGLIGSELVGTFSMEVAGPSARKKTIPSFGTGFTADTTPHAALWEETSDGSYMLTLLDMSMSPSEANDGGCDGEGLCMIVGHVDEQPTAWVFDGADWNAEMAGRPMGTTAGILMDGPLQFSGTSGATPLCAGFAYDGAGRLRAAYWWLDELEMWNSGLLPSLGPNAQSRANAVSWHPSMNTWVVGGGAETPQGHMMPGIWKEMTPGALDFDDKILLPVLSGMESGEVVALYEDTSGDYAVGNVTTAGGTSAAVLWRCGTGYTGCTPSVLPPLPEKTNVMVNGLGEGMPGTLAIIGTSYDQDLITDGRATLYAWDVAGDELIATIDANNLVIVGSPGSARVVSLADDYGSCFAASCLTAGTVVLDGGGRNAAAPSDAHAYAIRGAPRGVVPSVSEWGLVALALLTLTAGTICIRRKATSAELAD